MSNVHEVTGMTEHDGPTGFLRLYCPDSLTERMFGMGREASVSFWIDYEDHMPVTVWLHDVVTGRKESVPVENGGPFLEFLLDMVIEVGETSGRPWREPYSSKPEDAA